MQQLILNRAPYVPDQCRELSVRSCGSHTECGWHCG